MKKAFVALSIICLLTVPHQDAQASGPCPAAPGNALCFTPESGTTTYPRTPAANQPLKLHHVSLFTPNHETLAAWYRDMLGFEIAGRFTAKRPDGVEIEIIRMVMDGVWLNISRLPGLTERDRRLEYAGWRHISFGTGDVQQAWENLKARGADVVGTGRILFDPPGYAVAFVRDPDGNFIEFYQDIRTPSF